MICKNCGHECLEGKFCSECGAALEVDNGSVNEVVQTPNDNEVQKVLPPLQEIIEMVQNEATEDNVNNTTDDENCFFVDASLYNFALKKVDEYRYKARLPFILLFLSVIISLISFFSLVYIFGAGNSGLEIVSLITAYFNIPAVVLALVSFSLASHWFIACREFRFLKRPSFINTTFVFSVLAVLFTLTCFCSFTIPVMIFPL